MRARRDEDRTEWATPDETVVVREQPPEPTGPGAGPATRAARVRRAREALVSALDLGRVELDRLGDADLRRRAAALLRGLLGRLEPGLRGAERAAFAGEVLDETLGLGPLEPLLADDTVSEIMVNGARRIFVERAGRLEPAPRAFSDDQAVLAVIERIVAPLGRRIDTSTPMVDARLSDGSRVNAVIPPLSLSGPVLTVRKFARRRLGLDGLVARGTLSAPMADFLGRCVRARRSILVSGGTGSGKTTTLGALVAHIPEAERIITIEDAAELRLERSHWVALEARPPNLEGRGEVTIRDLVRNALRMRPDRIVVGECRGGEALDMLQAMSTGHEGSLTTLHANGTREALSRLETLVLMSGLELPVRAVRDRIASAIDIVVQQARCSDGVRRVTCISEVTGLESDVVALADVFRFEQTGLGAEGGVVGRHRPTGYVPRFYERLAARGVAVDRRPFLET